MRVNHRAIVAAVAASCALLAACGSSSDSGSSTSASGGSGTTSTTARAVYSGPKLSIPSGSNPAVPSKTIGVVTLTSASEVFSREYDAIVKAASALGWKVKQANMNGDVSKAGAATQNLLQAGVDGIVLQSVEPTLLGAKAVADAKAKGVPIVETFSVFNSKTSKGVLTASVNSDYEAAQAAVDKQMLADLGGSGDIALVNDKLASEGVVPEQQLRKDVAGKLKIVATHQMNYANLVPDISATVSTWLTQYPNLKAVWCPYDGPCVGAAQAIQSANKNVRVYSQNGNASILKLMRQGVDIVTAAQPLEYSNWLAIDQFNAIFAKRDFERDAVVPIVVVDKSNVPKTGVIDGSQQYGDFEAAFKKRWGVS
jgi:ABC-type sugar transport system substrate-binding protein